MINVTKTFLPPLDEYISTLKRAWDKSWITNNGELALELEAKLQRYLGVDHLLFFNNGTTVLQAAIRALGIKGEIITSPFSYVATTNAILWEGCEPVFADIDPSTFCIDPLRIEEAISERTAAILATHVYGYPCDVEEIGKIAARHNLRVIYDAAHAFGTVVDGKSVFDFGDVSTCSFHATKIFHTVEGGCTVTADEDTNRQLYLYRHFGHIGDEYFSVGINGKNSEFHAAMGLCNLQYIGQILERRKRQWHYYASQFTGTVFRILAIPANLEFNYAYFPLVFPSEADLLRAMRSLQNSGINPRRYFYPSLNTLHFVKYRACPVSEDLARRTLCLPLFYDLEEKDQDSIGKLIFKTQF